MKRRLSLGVSIYRWLQMSYYIYNHILYIVLIYHSISFPFPTPSLHQQHRGPMHFIWLQSHRPWMQQLVVFWLVPMEKLPSGEKWYISCHEMEMESWWWVSWGCFFFCVFRWMFFIFFHDLVSLTEKSDHLQGKRYHENAWKVDQSLYFFLQHHDAILYRPTKTISKVISKPTTSRL